MKTDNRELKARIAAARSRLHEKLKSIDFSALGLSEYNQRYLRNKTARLDGVLQLYGRVLFDALSDGTVPLEDFTFVDYGGGSGLISSLAAETGVGTVVYNDIYETSCEDVRLLTRALDLRLAHVVCGDVGGLVAYLQANRVRIDSIASYDVLEHIYDVESHFRALGGLQDPPYRVVYSSGANIHNARYVRAMGRKQIEVETRPRTGGWGHKDRDSLRAYLDVRREMIAAHAPELDEATVDRLARETRGLIRADIERCVDEFRRDGRIGYRIDHPTNTCDPFTGNWHEHLIDQGWLGRVVREAGFDVEIRTGRYNVYGPSWLKAAKTVLNLLLGLLGDRGMFLAPYYTVFAERRRG